MPRQGTRARPVVGVLACRKFVDPLWSHVVAEKYLYALDDAADVMPLLVPSLDHLLNPKVLFERLDGLLLPGSVSNIEPRHYNNNPIDDTDPRDSYRDNTALHIVHTAVDMRIPVLGICRGFQEINVAMGGSLHQRIETVNKHYDHREPRNKPAEEQFDYAHTIDLVEGGLLHTMIGKAKVKVNSLHGQGVKELGKDLMVEATAPDGLIEAFRHKTNDTLIMGVQWHPEWQTDKSLLYSAIFKAFGDACRQSRNRRGIYA